MGDEDVENYVDSVVEKKLKKLGFDPSSSSSAGGSSSSGGENAPSHLKGLIGEIKVVKELGEATRGDFDKIIAEGIKQKMAEQIVPALFGNNQSKGSFMDSGFMQQVGKGLGEKIPEYASVIIDSLTKNFGKDGAEKMIDKVMTAGGSGPEKGKEDDIIGSLDPDNPNHLHYYMALRNLGSVSAEDARKVLIEEKTAFMNRMKQGSSGNTGDNNAANMGAPTALENAIREQNVFLEKIIKRQNQSDEVIKFLVDKIERTEGGISGGISSGSIDDDTDIAQNLNKSWGEEIEKNKEKIRLENEEKERLESEIKRIEKERLENEMKRIEKERLEKEKESEKVVVVGKLRNANPVFE